jgi:hypothetical protein
MYKNHKILINLESVKRTEIVTNVTVISEFIKKLGISTLQMKRPEASCIVNQERRNCTLNEYVTYLISLRHFIQRLMSSPSFPYRLSGCRSQRDWYCSHSPTYV